MNTLPRTVRLVAAVAAFAITSALLGTVFAIAEPQRSILIARLERADKPAATQVAMATAATFGLRIAK